MKTSRSNRSRLIHLATRLGQSEILQMLVDMGCNVNVRAEAGDTAVILFLRHKRKDYL
jgi:hypothetical protein